MSARMLVSRFSSYFGGSDTRTNPLLLTVLICSVLLIYGNSVLSGFVWDDDRMIVQRSKLFETERAVSTIFTTPDTPSDEYITPYYRPFTSLTYFIDYRVWGLHPFWYHLENVLLHAAVVAVLYILIKMVFRDAQLAFFTAILFAVHPSNAEAINFISARNNLLCAIFMIITLMSLKKGGIFWVLVSLVSYLMSLFSKEPAVVMPFFMVSFTLLTMGKKNRELWALLGVFLGVTMVYFFLRSKAVSAFGFTNGIEISLERARLVASVIFEYCRLMLFPIKLNALYAPDYISFKTYKAILAGAGVALLLFLCFRKTVSDPVKGGSLWILWGLLPVANIVLIPSAQVAERYLYIPLMGFSLMLGYALRELQRKKALIGTAILIVILSIYGVRTFERNFVWRDNVSLFKSMISSDPRNPVPHYNLGVDYVNAGKLDLALSQFKETIRLNPRDAEAYNNIGNILLLKGEHRLAADYYDKALSLNPVNPIACFNRGLISEFMGDKEKAVSYYRLVVQMAEDNPIAAHRDIVQQAKERIKTLTE